jgi:hypothetical protein
MTISNSNFTIESVTRELQNADELGTVENISERITNAESLLLTETVSRMKTEILDLIASGRIPETVGTFSELHDYIDANCLGGFCEDSFTDPLIDYFGSREGTPGFIAFMNNAQNAIHEWLLNGHIN